MLSTSTVILALAATVAYAQDLSVQTPSLAQCANSVINFSGGSGPYYVAVVQGQDPCNDHATQEYFDVNDTSVSYTPVLSSGTQVVVYVEDANGKEAYSDLITLGDGDSSCLGVPTPTPTQDASGNTPTDDPTTDNYSNNYSDNSADNNTDNNTDNCTADDITDNDPTDNYAIDNDTADDSAPEDNSTDDGADTPDQSPSSDSSSTSTTGSTYNAPATPSGSASTDPQDNGATVQSTKNNKSSQDTTPANANGTGGATSLAVSAFTTLCATLVVSFSLF